MAGRAVYLSETQREHIRVMAESWLWRTEFPTWILILTIYSGWLCTVAWWKSLGIIPASVLLIWFSTWYMSLQHELIHGHPTRSPAINKLFGLMPFSIWYPYAAYRDLHLLHHHDEDLTIPEVDPESYYFTRARWARFNGAQRLLVRVRNTFAGRLLLAPILTACWTFMNILESFRYRHVDAIKMWLVHAVLLFPVIGWLRHYDFPVTCYVIFVTGPMLSLTSVRSFLEHRAEEAPEARSVINEAGFFWRLLFLNLNYHSVHHDLPAIPWYALPAVYRRNKADYLRRNQGFYVEGYGQLMRQHLIKPAKIEINPVFPDGQSEGRTGEACEDKNDT